MLFFRIVLCIFGAGLMLYAYIDQQNRLTEMRLQLPQIEKELKAIREENTRLKYDIDSFESPIHLMDLSRKPEFGHLKYPYTEDVIQLEQKKTITGYPR